MKDIHSQKDTIVLRPTPQQREEHTIKERKKNYNLGTSLLPDILSGNGQIQ
jgi:hypothetical protein